MATLGTGGKKETTEWEDILREKGVIAEKTEEELLEETLGQLVEDVAENYDPHARKDVAELDEDLEDADSEEERVLQRYREARLAELKSAAMRPRFGPGVRRIAADEWKTEVTACREDAHVVVVLFQPSLERCELLLDCAQTLAAKFPHTKFVSCRATDAIKNYPDEKLPTVLVYKGGAVLKQFVGLAAFRGLRTNADDLEWALSRIDAVDSDMVEPPNAEQNSSFNIRRI
mmetsp:Transcript_15499/g.41634  ORF Transcript_15499/g.41634 Transcript_15499/m.41634 type:complete len:231 (+) Transcript_15499:114-806(+)